MMECSSGNCTLNCTDYYSCRDSIVNCSPDGLCTVNCYPDFNQYTYGTCFHLELICPLNGICIFNFDGRSTGYDLGHNIIVTCKENSTCAIRCTSSPNNPYSQCYRSRITCPRYSGDCTVECSGRYACRYLNIECGPGRNCLSCSGQYSCERSTLRLYSIDTAYLICSGLSSCQNAYTGCQNNDCIITCAGDSACQYARFTCPANNNCTINCDGQYSCQNARVTCPTGDYSCNILCTDPLSCQNLSITNTHNVNLLCCGGETACAGTSVVPTSTDCPYIT